MLRSRPVFTILLLAVLQPMPTTAHAQWIPNGVKLASHVWPRTMAAVGDGMAGMLVFAPELDEAAPRHLVERVGAGGTIPAGWPSTAVEPRFFSAGLASDGLGGAYVGNVHAAGGSSIVVQHLLASGALDPAWPPDGRVLADAAGYRSVLFVEDGSHGVYAVWVVEGDSIREMRALRLLSSGAAAPGWPGDGVLLARSTKYIYLHPPRANAAGLYAFGGLGDAYPSSGDDGTFAARVTPDGAIPSGWSPGPVSLPDAQSGGDEWHAPDPAGGLFYLVRFNHLPLRLKHLLPDASTDPAWPVAGYTPVSDTARFAFLFAPVSDGAGGCFATFSYDSSGTLENGLDPSVVHLTTDGTSAPGWPTLGVRLPFRDTGIEGARLVPDEQGGVYALWLEQYPAGSGDGTGFRLLRAHHISHDAVTAPGWPADGLSLASGPGARLQFTGVSDTHGGVVVAWEDSRSDTTGFGGIEVYTLGIGPDGSFTTSVPPAQAGIATALHASPVPAIGETRLAFTLGSPTRVSLLLFDAGGRVVRRLHAGVLEAGMHSVTWDGRDEGGRLQAPGIYLARAEIGGVISSTRIVRLR